MWEDPTFPLKCAQTFRAPFEDQAVGAEHPLCVCVCLWCTSDDHLRGAASASQTPGWEPKAEELPGNHSCSSPSKPAWDRHGN